MEVFLQCPLRYQYRQEWKIPVPPDGLTPTALGDAEQPSVSAAQLGTLVHATLEAFHQPGPMDGKGGLARLRQIWDTVCEGELDHQSADEVWTDRAVSLFQNYLASEVASWPTVATEQEFNLAYQGALVRGFVDRLATAPSGVATVVDYKTGRVGSAAAYGMQLDIYKDALRANGVEADAILLSLRTGVVVKPLAHESPVDVLVDVRAATRRAPSDAPCRECAFRKSCPTGSQGRR